MARDRSIWTTPLIDNGWKLENACVCGGVYREDFVNDSLRGYEISIYPEPNSKVGPRFVIKFYKLIKLKQSLNSLGTTLTTYEFKKTKAA